MLKEMKYGALSGKTRAMYGKLLRSRDYNVLIQKKSISDVVSYLKYETHYKNVLSDVEEALIHRTHLENLLRQDLINDYSKLLRFTHGKLRDFISILYTKTEIEDLKLIFRVYEAGHADKQMLEDSLHYISRREHVNVPKLVSSKNLEEFLSGLRGTIYYDILRPFASKNNEIRLFSMEMALDLFYLRNLHNTYKNLLNTKDSGIIREMAGLESDIFNIFLIYRAKSFYYMSAEIIKSYTLPLVYKLKKRTMEALINAKTSEEFEGILKDTIYGFLFEGKDSLLYEHNYAEYIYKAYKRNFRNNPFSIACVVSYLRMKEMEISNIISIIEGIRYKLPESTIRRFVVGMFSKT